MRSIVEIWLDFVELSSTFPNALLSVVSIPSKQLNVFFGTEDFYLNLIKIIWLDNPDEEVPRVRDDQVPQGSHERVVTSTASQVSSTKFVVFLTQRQRP